MDLTCPPSRRRTPGVPSRPPLLGTGLCGNRLCGGNDKNMDLRNSRLSRGCRRRTPGVPSRTSFAGTPPNPFSQLRTHTRLSCEPTLVNAKPEMPTGTHHATGSSRRGPTRTPRRGRKRTPQPARTLRGARTLWEARPTLKGHLLRAERHTRPRQNQRSLSL